MVYKLQKTTIIHCRFGKKVEKQCITIAVKVVIVGNVETFTTKTDGRILASKNAKLLINMLHVELYYGKDV
jgi:hypothetical protein